MVLKELLSENPLVLAEGAVIERIKREFKYELNPYIQNAAMVYDSVGRKILEKIFIQYISVAFKFDLPMLNLAPTWRTNPKCIKLAGYQDKSVNADCVKFLKQIRSHYIYRPLKILIGGLVGCKGDAYNPKEALTSEEAFIFHKNQVEELSTSGVDFLLASTLPALSEALGIAKAMADSKCEYILSFIIRPDGTILDGTSLYEAISIIDNSVSPKPAFYMINCVHPTICKRAINSEPNNSRLVRTRLKGLQANGSSKSPEELESLNKVDSENPKTWSKKMIDLYQNSEIQILGGCCGTNHRHIMSIAKNYIKKVKSHHMIFVNQQKLLKVMNKNFADSKDLKSRSSSKSLPLKKFKPKLINK
ncbi:MAG: homocysteine S-methyltransferase family protein [Promethearchaeota archaeon]